MDSCEAMDMIDKLNKEFSELQDKYNQLEEENQKLKFNECCLYINTENFKKRFYADIYTIFGRENQLAVECGLENNVILKEIYNWEGFTGDDWYRGDDDFPCVPAPDFSQDLHNPKNRKLVDTFKGGVYN